MKQPLFLSVLVLFTGAFSLADVFKYDLIGYPKEERNCHSQTSTIALLFEQGAKVKVVHTECVRERQTGYDFSIEYEAPQKLEFTSTENYLTLVYSPGRYKEKESCLKNLPSQTELFIRATGLNPIFSFCRSQELSSGKNWEVVITARDKSIIHPELGGYLMFTQPQGISFEEIAQGLKRVIENRGGFFADLVFQYDAIMAMGGASVHYYNSKKIDFNLERLSQVPSLERCYEQARETSSFLKAEQNSIFTVYCGGPYFNYYELQVGTVDKPTFSWQSSVDSFTSFDECQAHREEVLSHYAGSPANPLLGGLCSRDYQSNRYHVTVFKKK